MPFDGFSTSALVWELQGKLLRARVDHISQPERLEVVLNLRQPGKNFPLLLSADPIFARVHFAASSPSSLGAPTGFCMLLRKHLSGARLTDISQSGWERVINFTFQNGAGKTLRLTVELMGRHSNIILLDPDENLILDAVKHVTSEVNRFRELVPGARYLAPPKGGRLSPEELTAPTLKALLLASESGCKQLLLDSLVGLSSFLAVELLAQSGYEPDVLCPEVEPEKLWQSWQRLLSLREACSFDPCLISGGHDFAALLPISCSYLRSPSVEAAVAQAKGAASEARKLSAAKGTLRQAVRRSLARAGRKLAAQQAELAAAEDAEQYRIKGEMLKAGLDKIPPGSSQASLPNYYDPELRPIIIALEPSLSPQANAEKYFHRYGKLKKAVQQIALQIASSQEELSYLESVEQSLSDAQLEDLPEIEAELRATGYLPHQRKRQKLKDSRPRSFRCGDHEILVGRNNYQNERLTLKQAKRDDIWLHAKQIPGSHVIVHPGTEDEEIIIRAARLAAYFSKARSGQNVPVDYTFAKYVHKPNGSRPGFVIYRHERTVYVNPVADSESE